MVSEIDFVLLPTQNMDRAVAFYGTHFGLTPARDFNGVYVEFDMGNSVLGLMDSAAMGFPFSPCAGGGVGLRVDEDLETVRTRLAAAGVQVSEGLRDSGVCHIAFVSDPDGNTLMLHHRYAPGADLPKASG